MRLTSETKDFPYQSPRVPFILVHSSGKISWGKGLHEKRELVARGSDGTLLAVWPGEWSSDTFIVDDLEVAAWELMTPKMREKLQKAILPHD